MKFKPRIGLVRGWGISLELGHRFLMRMVLRIQQNLKLFAVSHEDGVEDSAESEAFCEDPALDHGVLFWSDFNNFICL
jgi:hypothetical protein